MPGTKEPIDFLHLSQQTGADKELGSELLILFSEQCMRQIAMMSDQSLDVLRRSDAAHTLKGAALAVGAWRVAKAAGEVETALRQEGHISLDEIIAAADETRHFIAGLNLAT